MNSVVHGSLAIRGGRDLAGEPFDLDIVDGVIAPRGRAEPGRVLSAVGLTVAPGYIDLQVNGAAGCDLSTSPDRMWDVAAALPVHGVTSFLPTIVTSPRATAGAAMRALAAGPPTGWRGARPIGLHLEGPMIAASRSGAHVAADIVLPSLAVIHGWSRDAGVAMVTLAPELAGATTVIAELVRRGVVVAAGHTDADADHARTAVDAGVSAVTHLFNAMAPMHHRDPGLAGAVLAGLPVVASLIADGVHVDPDAFRLAWTALGPSRRLLVSDAVAALGAPPGRYMLASREIVSDDRGSRTLEGGLAGGVIGLDVCVGNCVAMTGCALSDAVVAATETPAHLLSRPELGVLRPGAVGDVVMLDARHQVVATVVSGVVVFRRPEC